MVRNKMNLVVHKSNVKFLGANWLEIFQQEIRNIDPEYEKGMHGVVAAMGTKENVQRPHPAGQSEVQGNASTERAIRDGGAVEGSLEIRCLEPWQPRGWWGCGWERPRHQHLRLQQQQRKWGFLTDHQLGHEEATCGLVTATSVGQWCQVALIHLFTHSASLSSFFQWYLLRSCHHHANTEDSNKLPDVQRHWYKTNRCNDAN